MACLQDSCLSTGNQMEVLLPHWAHPPPSQNLWPLATLRMARQKDHSVQSRHRVASTNKKVRSFGGKATLTRPLGSMVGGAGHKILHK